MPRIKKGEFVGIPCNVSPGPFEEELLVDFDTLDGQVTGFAKKENIQEIEGQQHIKGQVLSVHRDYVTVMVEGSFFTTNGLANVPSDKVENLPLAA